MRPPAHVLVICTANICRSPMAAGLLRHALAAQPEPLRSLPVLSSGISARAGAPVTDHSVTTLKKVGIGISGHVSRPVTQDLLNGALAVLCMTESHREMIRLMADPVPRNLLLFREFMTTGSKEVADPYGCALPYYEACRDEMVEALPSLVKFLKHQVK